MIAYRWVVYLRKDAIGQGIYLGRTGTVLSRIKRIKTRWGRDVDGCVIVWDEENTSNSKCESRDTPRTLLLIDRHSQQVSENEILLYSEIGSTADKHPAVC